MSDISLDELLNVDPEGISESLTVESPFEHLPAHEQAFIDYYRLGSGRSLNRLVQKYLAMKESGLSVPTVSLRTLLDWSAKYGWVERVHEMDQRAAEMVMRSAINELPTLFRAQAMIAITLAERLKESLSKSDIFENARLGEVIQAIKMLDEMTSRLREMAGMGVMQSDGRHSPTEIVVNMPASEATITVRHRDIVDV